MIDRATGAAALADVTGGSIDFTVTGTNAPPLLIELVDLLGRGDNRAFLREVFKNGTRVSKVFRNANGTLLVSFRGYAGLRQFLTGTVYGVGNPRVSVISSAVRNSNHWAGTLRSVGGRIPVISYVIVGAIDVVQWLQNPTSERDLTDLLGTLFYDISVIAISTIAGAVAAAAALSLVASAPVWLVVGAGIGVAVGVGIALDMVNNAFGITQFIQNTLNKVQSSMWDFAVAMGEAIDAVAEFATHANPGDGQITGPTDYMMELERGVMNYIYSRLRFP